ncbi:hypothetical protein PC9H_005461 [Pleurotus ostreatus]|uniref:Uncharacterized protein n=1 Tax=Pleurotus ostreatus TaxID=5322 RepID=A0A8H6ZX52_PLEOS|nr:uncharacterized protein PC9H_005461 [Pleurotus ostreatus]KAF7433505.1 hypothetical protein PC9H_005461 [Pleurotus ostreatus]KAJ8697783.1 hypothetical protein PTI98_004555 [Pleurotus ostreatus]
MPPYSPRPTSNTIFYAPVSPAIPSPRGWPQAEAFDPYSPLATEGAHPASVPLLNQRRQTTSIPAPGGPRPFRQNPGNRPQYIPLRDSHYDAPIDDKLKPPSSALTDTSFLNTPSDSYFPNRPNYRHTRKHPFSSSFEAPNWKIIIIHVVLCLLAYPVMMIFVLLARDRTLFWTRLVVGFGCGLVGVSLGLSLLNLGRALLEAASWATLIHQSRDLNQPGVRLRDLAATSEDSASALTAFRVLRTRWSYSGTSRRQRSGYDSRFWSLYIVYFLFLVLAAASLSFVLGRIVGISTSVSHQYINYREVPVKGDLSDADLARADVLQAEFNDYSITWTISPFSEHGGMPSTVSFPWEGDTVYFSESIRAQFLPNGSGFGRLDSNISLPLVAVANSTEEMQRAAATTVDSGALIRYPRWGIRIHCLKATDPSNIVERSALNLSYLFTPRETLRELFSSFQMPLPDLFEKPINLTRNLAPGDNVTGVNLDEAALGAAFYNNGVGHSMKSQPLFGMGADGTGFVTLEAVLVRLNTSYTPEGKFLYYSQGPGIPDATGAETKIGFDGAMCLELYEPWVVETYNSTYGSPSSMKIVSKTNQVIDNMDKETRKGDKIKNMVRQLNSTRMGSIYEVAHGNSVNQIIKDNGRDSFYVPSPTVVSFSQSSIEGGRPSRGYTELSADLFGQARALADASNVLSYFAGTGDIVGRSFEDLVLSSAHIDWPLMVGFVVIVMAIGLIAGLFVPKLPLGVPRRGFHVYSWLAAFQGGEIAADIQRAGLEKNMELREIEQRLGDIRFRYVV